MALLGAVTAMRPPVRHRCAPAPRWRQGVAGVFVGQLHRVPARAGVDLGTPGAGACAGRGGDASLLADFEQVRAQTLGRERDMATLYADVLKMRGRMRTELDRSDAARLDLKQGAGGVVDLEFLLQTGVLARSAQVAGAAAAARHAVVDRCAGGRRFPARCHRAGAAWCARHAVGRGPGLHAGPPPATGPDHMRRLNRRVQRLRRRAERQSCRSPECRMAEDYSW